MSPNSGVLAVRAGAAARARLQSDGLNPSEVAVVPAAADGPKGLALIGLDKAIFGDWLPRAPRERWLIGASIGAWRMTAACRTEPHRAFDRLVDLYCDEQDYTARPSAAEVTTVCKRLVERLLDGDDHAVLAHPHHRLAVLAVRGRGPLASDHRGVLLGWGMAAAANALGRRNLARFMDRGVFATESAKVPYFGRRFDAFRNQVTPLDRNNLHAALLASASIPVVLQGVTHIAGAPAGTYWDGGIIDYQLALPYAETRGLVLYPHYIESVTPGWLDKPYPKRRVRPAQLDNVVMVGPSREFISRLPASKLPDRSDFKRYASEPKRRGRAWREVADASHALGEAFLRWCEKPDLALVRGFDEH